MEITCNTSSTNPSASITWLNTELKDEIPFVATLSEESGKYTITESQESGDHDGWRATSKISFEASNIDFGTEYECQVCVCT